MIIPLCMGETPIERKARLCRQSEKTARKLKNRLDHFLKHVDDHKYLTKQKKQEIKEMFLKP